MCCQVRDEKSVESDRTPNHSHFTIQSDARAFVHLLKKSFVHLLVALQSLEQIFNMTAILLRNFAKKVFFYWIVLCGSRRVYTQVGCDQFVSALGYTLICINKTAQHCLQPA